MKDNKKLEEFLNTKVGELGKKYFESFMEEGKKIVENAKEEFNKIVEEDKKEDSVVTGPLELQDLSNNYDELVRITVDTFNRMLKENGVDTDLYSLNYQDCLNEKIFGNDLLNCTIQGILNQNCNEDLLIELLKIAEKVCNAVDYKDFKLVKIRMDEGSKNSNSMIFDVTFRSNTHFYDVIKVGFYEALEGDFDPDNDIFIKNYAKLSIGDKRFLPAILHSGAVNSEIGLITSTFSNDEELDCHDDETYNKITLAMKTNRENLADKFKLIINDLSV